MNRPLRLALPKGNFSEQTIKALIKIGYRIAFKENYVYKDRIIMSHYLIAGSFTSFELA